MQKFSQNNSPQITRPILVNASNTIYDLIKQQIPTEIPFSTTAKNVKSIIRKLSNKKAPGPDHITNTTLKNLPKKAIGILTSLINAIISTTHFPEAMKKAEVMMIPKQGKYMRTPQNHRPIGLISTLGKVTEAVILEKIKEETLQLNFLPPEKFGFRSQHFTTQQTIRVVEYISEAFTKKHYAPAIFFDGERAFDNVWHQGLIQKIPNFNYSKRII